MFCTHCGAEINDDAFVCVKCGCRVDQKLPAAQANAQRDDTMVTVIKVFLILGCIAEGWLLIPLAWCIPMTVKIFNCLKTGTPISTGMKVCICCLSVWSPGSACSAWTTTSSGRRKQPEERIREEKNYEVLFKMWN